MTTCHSDSVRILGIDPGLASFGAVLVECSGGQRRIVDARTFMSDASATRRGVAKADDRFRRARDLSLFLVETITETRPDLIACESMSFPRGAQAVAAIALSWGVIASATHGFPVVCAQPKAWRKAIAPKDATETAAHAVVMSIAGASIIGELNKGRRVHALDAAGVALWADNTDEFLSIWSGRMR